MFADDTNIFYSNSCLKTLNKIIQLEIDKIADWLNVNKLSINTTKTKFMLFRSSKKKHKHNITITINNNNIKQVKNTTFLGIIIDKCKMSRFDVYADRETADSLERRAQLR